MAELTAAELRAALEEAVLRIRDLTRNLDESPGMEAEDQLVAELQQARTRVNELERALAEAERAEAGGKT
jgi:hypothetical protein